MAMQRPRHSKNKTLNTETFIPVQLEPPLLVVEWSGKEPLQVLQVKEPGPARGLPMPAIVRGPLEEIRPQPESPIHE